MRADLEPFLDGLIDSQLRNRDVAGAVVAVVKDGEVLLAKGYGFADFQQKRPVNAEETLFRPGSIAKLFTAIAVMQLVERGKLDLDRDIRDYLDFEIPRKFPEPITLRRILTHTPGFEESVKNLFGSGDALRRATTWSPTCRRRFSARRRPGLDSNYGLGLAGYIVERTSGEAFVDYLEKHIFAPLGMASSTFKQRLPEALEGRMSMDYNRGSKRPKPFEISNPPPAGALSTTGTDMTRFMIALLNGGTLDGASILQPDTLRKMQTRQNELHPQLRAMGIGFMEYSQNGQTMWGHGGDTLAFHSDLFLLPEARFGFYISYNSAGNRPGSGRGEVQRALLDRYFPRSDSPAGLPVNEALAHGREVTGMHDFSRRSETNALRVGALLGQVAVKTDRDGILTIENSKNIRGQLKRWREIAPYFYRED